MGQDQSLRINKPYLLRVNVSLELAETTELPKSCALDDYQLCFKDYNYLG
jgi:hypothetical protein